MTFESSVTIARMAGAAHVPVVTGPIGMRGAAMFALLRQ